MANNHHSSAITPSPLYAFYQYKAIDKTGRPARGGLEAVNEVDLELRLRRMGLDLITYKEIDRQAATFTGAGGKITRQDLINFCFDMEQMAARAFPSSTGCATCATPWTTRASVRCSR